MSDMLDDAAKVDVYASVLRETLESFALNAGIPLRWPNGTPKANFRLVAEIETALWSGGGQHLADGGAEIRPWAPAHLYPGAQVKLRDHKRPFTVRATSNRYTIATKPFNPQRTVHYTIIDWRHRICGPENLVFSMGAETTEDCLEMMVRLLDHESGVSHRHHARIDGMIEWIRHDDEQIWPVE